MTWEQLCVGHDQVREGNGALWASNDGGISIAPAHFLGRRRWSVEEHGEPAVVGRTTMSATGRGRQELNSVAHMNAK